MLIIYMNMSTEFIPKIPILTCELCNTTTSNKKDYNKHLLTRKHLKRKYSTENQQKSTNLSQYYKCDLCDKDYTCRSGLWRHKQLCNDTNLNHDITTNNQIIQLDDTPTENVIIAQSSEVKLLTSLVIEVVKNNQELQKQSCDFQKQMVDMCKTMQSSITMNNNCNNNSNNTFNMQVFLNEECKDAINMSDFLNSFTVELEDLEDVGRLGYATGISNMIVKELKLLDIYKRPIHCSDLRREIFYVKDNDVWERETPENSKVKKAINNITKKNMVKLSDWRDKYPDCMDIESEYNDIYVKLMMEAYGGRGDQTVGENKIIKNIAREVVITKK
jgi:hypothetical protein